MSTRAEEDTGPMRHRAPVPSYHDLHITTIDIPRTSIFNLPYQLCVTCNRVAGWEVWDYRDPTNPRMIAGEFAGDPKGLMLDVAGFVIVDSLSGP